MAFTPVSVPYISADIYKTGIKTNILDANGDSNTRLCVCLLGSNFNILAYSAVLSCSSELSSAAEAAKDATNYNAEFEWSNETKTLTIPTIPYTVTKNISNIVGGAMASYFAVIKLTKQEGGEDEAFEGSGYYQFPKEGSLESLDNNNLLIVGNISSTPTINSNSNFRLTKTTITFSETSAS